MKLGIIVSHRWPLRRGKVRIMVKVKVVEQGMTRWKLEASSVVLI